MGILAAVIVVVVFVSNTFCQSKSPHNPSEGSGISSLNEWYAAVAKDVQAGRPLVFTHFVPLCDNVHQGIAPVPKHLGDGDNLKTNLYWGAAFGYGTWFKKKSKWKLISDMRPASRVLAEVLVFERTFQPKGQLDKFGVKKPINAYLIIIGYKGRYIDRANRDFLNALSGKGKSPLADFDELKKFAGLKSHLVSYSGHNYLMDLKDSGADLLRKNLHSSKDVKAAMILACHSKSYFEPALESAGVLPLVLTTNFMAPEAYTADAVYESLLAGGSARQIHSAAGNAYAKYQKISQKAGRGMFYSKGM